MTSNPRPFLEIETFDAALRHIDELCGVLDIDLVLIDTAPPEYQPNTSPPNAFMVTEWRRGWRTKAYILIVGWNVDPELAYWVALHEAGHEALGHVSSDLTIDKYEEYKVEHEADAWVWAFETSEFQPTPKVVNRLSTHWFSTYLPHHKFDVTDNVAKMLRLIGVDYEYCE
jgi:hypothetical protein